MKTKKKKKKKQTNKKQHQNIWDAAKAVPRGKFRAINENQQLIFISQRTKTHTRTHILTHTHRHRHMNKLNSKLAERRK